MSYSHIQNSRCYLLQVNIISSLKLLNLKPITTSTYNGIIQCISMLSNCQIFHSHGHNMSEQGGSLLTCLNPHIKIIHVDYYHRPSWLWSTNGTNSNHLENCSIITKTYQLCQGVKLNGLKKSKFHQYPNPIIGKGYRWGVGALKDAQIWSHAIYIETNC